MQLERRGLECAQAGARLVSHIRQFHHCMPCTALHTLTATPLVIERPDYGVKVAWGELSTDMWAQPAVAAERATAGIQKTNTDRVPLGTPFAKSICRGDANRTSRRF